MSNLVKDITTFETKVYKISGPLGKNMVVKSGQKKIEIGQILSFDETTGKLVKYEKRGEEGTPPGNEAFTIALSEVDATSNDATVLVAVPNTVFNSKEIKGATLTDDFKVVKDLWGNGIILEEVE